jgi:hypothetical protein
MYRQNGIYSFNFDTEIKILIGVDNNTVMRLSDGATIPFDPANTDYQAVPRVAIRRQYTRTG